MDLNIKTTAKNGQLIVYIINKNNVKILTVHENGTGSCLLVPGEKYSFEWHTWNPAAADYTIIASVTGNPTGFPALNFAKSYSGPATDAGVFSFTV